MLFPSGPLAVSWLVVPKGVYSFQGKILFSRSHIRKRILKAVSPAFANRYASPTVIRIDAVVRIVTAPESIAAHDEYSGLRQTFRELPGRTGSFLASNFRGLLNAAS